MKETFQRKELETKRSRLEMDTNTRFCTIFNAEPLFYTVSRILARASERECNEGKILHNHRNVGIETKLPKFARTLCSAEHLETLVQNSFWSAKRATNYSHM